MLQGLLLYYNFKVQIKSLIEILVFKFQRSHYTERPYSVTNFDKVKTSIFSFLICCILILYYNTGKRISNYHSLNFRYII